jgi:hypothetical protein
MLTLSLSQLDRWKRDPCTHMPENLNTTQRHEAALNALAEALESRMRDAG